MNWTECDITCSATPIEAVVWFSELYLSFNFILSLFYEVASKIESGFFLIYGLIGLTR